MKYYFINIISAVLIGFLVASCSDIQPDVSAPVEKVAVHKTGFVAPNSPNFHGKEIRDNNWNMKTCQECHAADFSGGLTGAACTTCHTAPGGPEACNTCHGDFSNPERIAPPRDINGNVSTTEISVGAHSKHLYDNTFGKAVLCSTCHKVPSSVYAPGHLDSSLPAEVQLTGMAKINQASDAAYNADDATCSNTYCHGNFAFYKDSARSENTFIYTADKMVGNNKTVIWNKVDGSQDQCGSCHGLPPQGHLGFGQWGLNTCISCHYGVVDENGKIIDKNKHINGVINVRGN